MTSLNIKVGNEILALIPARGGSKSIPKKNIYPIAGKPLIAYSIQQALESKLITRVIVSTDDKEIALLAEKLGAGVPFLRPTKYATDKASSVSALQHAVNFMEKNNSIKYDIIVELMCTNPLKTHEL